MRKKYHEDTVSKVFFSVSGEKVILKYAEPSLALPYPSSGHNGDENMTGVWLELTDEHSSVLYRLDCYALMHSVSASEFVLQDEFEALMPYLPNARKIRLFAPPPAEKLMHPIFGTKSHLKGEFDIPPLKKRAAPPKWHCRTISAVKAKEWC